MPSRPFLWTEGQRIDSFDSLRSPSTSLGASADLFAVSPALKGRVNVGRPSGTRSIFSAFPALKRWAKIGRPYAAGALKVPMHSVASSGLVIKRRKCRFPVVFAAEARLRTIRNDIGKRTILGSWSRGRLMKRL